MGKKADSTGLQFIIVIIIAIAFAIIYFFWLGDYRTFGDKLTDYQICKSSNYESAMLKVRFDGQVVEERKGNKCKTEYLDVKKDKELSTIANKMAGCWDMYLEGKMEIFETDNGNFCAVCSVLTFEDKTKLTGLSKYIAETKMPNREITYYDYLTRTTVTKDVFQQIENSELNKQHTIDTDKPLAVIFAMQKDAHPGSLTGESGVVNAVGGAIVGLAIGIGLCFTGVGCLAVVSSVATGTTGYLIGSNNNPDLDTKILLWPYTNDDLKALDCTVLEGQDRLDIRK